MPWGRTTWVKPAARQASGAHVDQGVFAQHLGDPAGRVGIQVDGLVVGAGTPWSTRASLDPVHGVDEGLEIALRRSSRCARDVGGITVEIGAPPSTNKVRCSAGTLAVPGTGSPEDGCMLVQPDDVGVGQLAVRHVRWPAGRRCGSPPSGCALREGVGSGALAPGTRGEAPRTRQARRGSSRPDGSASAWSSRSGLGTACPTAASASPTMQANKPSRAGAARPQRLRGMIRMSKWATQSPWGRWAAGASSRQAGNRPAPACGPA